MPYVLRYPDGQIASLHREPQPGTEFLALDHLQVQEFLGGSVTPAQQFASLDADLVRVLEDLIDALIQRNVLMVTDLPAEAQQKLFNRKNVRNSMKNYSLRLFDVNPEEQSAADEIVPSDFGGL